MTSKIKGVPTVPTSTPLMGLNEGKKRKLGGENIEIGPIGENGEVGGDTFGYACKSGLDPNTVNRYPARITGPLVHHHSDRPGAPENLRKAKRTRFVALNETGTQRIGEDHPRAKLSDAQVEAMRDDYEAHPPGHPQHVGYRALAKKYGCSKRTARDICNYTKRNQWAARWKRIAEP
jgi:hypothetical protein